MKLPLNFAPQGVRGKLVPSYPGSPPDDAFPVPCRPHPVRDALSLETPRASGSFYLCADCRGGPGLLLPLRGAGGRLVRSADQAGGGAAVLHAWCQAVAPEPAGGPRPLAAAPGGDGQHLPAVSAAGALAHAAGAPVAEPGHLPRLLVSVRPARDRAVGHRLHLHGGGQCVGGGVQRLGLQHPRHLPLAGAGGADDQCAGGGGRYLALHSGHHGAADAALRGGAPVTPPHRWLG